MLEDRMNNYINIAVPSSYLKALKLFAAAKTEKRFHLRCVSIEASGKEARISATDGNHLGLFTVPQSKEGGGLSVIIPLELLGNPPVTGTTVITAGALDESGTRSVRVRHNSGWSIVGTSIDTAYPDYRRVVPTKVSGVVAQFNYAYMKDFVTAARGTV